MVGAVYASLERQCLERIDVRIADDIFQVSLHGVNPALQIESVFDGVAVVGVADGGINVIGDVIVSDDLTEDLIALFGKRHVFIF